MVIVLPLIPFIYGLLSIAVSSLHYKVSNDTVLVQVTKAVLA
jgi:hypothetical protein